MSLEASANIEAIGNTDAAPTLNENESNGNAAVETVAGEQPQPISKHQLKRQRKLENILKNRGEKRKQEREKRKLKKVLKKAAAAETSEPVEYRPSRKTLKKNLMENSVHKLRICVDLSYESLMTDSDICHLCKQITFCYAANRRMAQPLQLYLTDYKGKTKNMVDKFGAPFWDIHRLEANYLDAFKTDIENGQVCYLTSDSPNVLETFDESQVYLIGGLVDHNNYKLLSYNTALKHNLKHCRLPIDKYLNMKTRKVLTVNQIYEIICKYVETNDWKDAFMSIIPKRKGAICADEEQNDEKPNGDDTNGEELKQDGNKPEENELK